MVRFGDGRSLDTDLHIDPSGVEAHEQRPNRAQPAAMTQRQGRGAGGPRWMDPADGIVVSFAAGCGRSLGTAHGGA